jgi:hypothetical protein
MRIKNCPCGSEERRFEQYDAAGIFCYFYCSKCGKEKRKKYNPRIFQSGTAYASSGEEEDLY